MTITVSANILNFNLYANRLTSQHGSAVTVSGSYVPGSAINLVINSGIVVGSATTSYALTIGSGWSATDAISITNNGYIVGKGGTGGGQSGSTAYAPVAGSPALEIINTGSLVNVTNNGTIGGGGGGGGAAFLVMIPPPNGSGIFYSGGGGAGYSAGSAGIATAVIFENTSNLVGNPGTLTAGGTYNATGPMANAASGGSLGQSGFTNIAGSPGAAGGAAVTGNAYVTWLATGTRLGSIA